MGLPMSVRKVSFPLTNKLSHREQKVVAFYLWDSEENPSFREETELRRWRRVIDKLSGEENDDIDNAQGERSRERGTEIGRVRGQKKGKEGGQREEVSGRLKCQEQMIF